MKQISFDPLDFPADSHRLAKQARDARYRELKKAGASVKRWKLPGQIRQYSGFGQPDGRVRDIYFINVQ